MATASTDRDRASKPGPTETEYRDVAGFPGYRVGSDGTVWSCKLRGRRHGPGESLEGGWWRLAVRPNRCGYLSAGLWKEGRSTYLPVHRLVLEAFVGPRPAKMGCRHLDGNPLNNNLDNLKWGTVAENAADRVAHGRQNRPTGTSNKNAKLTESDVRAMIQLDAEGFDARQIASRFGVSYSCASAVICRKTWKHLDMNRHPDGPRLAERRKRMASPRGSRHGGAKLGEGDIPKLKLMAASGMSLSVIAKQFGVCAETVRLIVIGKTWSHVYEASLLLVDPSAEG